jgi:pimeloyl-ACP methyl ester carboxylesterase
MPTGSLGKLLPNVRLRRRIAFENSAGVIRHREVFVGTAFPLTQLGYFANRREGGTYLPVPSSELMQPEKSVRGRPQTSGALAQVRSHPYTSAALAASAILVASAMVNRQLARRAEQHNPPAGRFVRVDDIRLHYVEQGEGEPLVLLHGNGSMLQDFECSGLIDKASQNHRVLAFDRPGYGYSDRPRTRVWTADAQADLLCRALRLLGISRAVVLGHSWGASVALALAIKHPAMVKGLVLASGYYYPSARTDVLLLAWPAIPIIGDALRFTVSPLLARALWPKLINRMFSPNPIPQTFTEFPKELALRPSQIRASAEEAALMIPQAAAWQPEYAELKIPVVIVAGQQDQIVDFSKQSARLHAELPNSKLISVPRNGHMIHHTATGFVMRAIKLAAVMNDTDESERVRGTLSHRETLGRAKLK